MANLQVKYMDDSLYSRLRALAQAENRSISQEVVTILEAYLIDTDIIIYSLKGHAAVQRNFALNEKSPKAISVITYW